MKRALRRFVSTLTGTRKYVFFTVLILICVMAICLGIYAQFFYKYSATDAFMLGINIGSQKTAEEIDILKSEFNKLFTNTIIINSENVRVDRTEPAKDIVYTGYDFVNEDENFYSVNAQIPVININSEVAQKVNVEIKKEFVDKANTVMRSREGSTVYTVSYASFINQDILSLQFLHLQPKNRKDKIGINSNGPNL